MPKFTPRQRKHKVIARVKRDGEHPQDYTDTNIFEHTPKAKVELEKERHQMRENLRNQGIKVSSKKAKRLEKYIENKLKKDENRELVERLAKSKTDTSLYRSSKSLGQGKASSNNQLSRRYRNQEAGLNDTDENSSIVHLAEGIESVIDEALSGDTSNEGTYRYSEKTSYNTLSESKTLFHIGTGLKRSINTDDDGRPLLKRRKLRGGVKSKVSFKTQAPSEPEWKGFDSLSDTGNSTMETATMTLPTTDDVSESESGGDVTLSESSGACDSEHEDDSSSSQEPTDSPSHAQRSSAFKSWASAQLNEAVGHQTISDYQMPTETSTMSSFQPRAKEEDPLPKELEPTANLTRKAFSINVVRQSDLQASRLKLPVVAEEQKIMEAIHNNNIVVIHGATGSGKTTQVPQFLFEAGYGSPDSSTPGMIGITQPRRVAAVSMAKRVGDELGNFGKRVAYQIRFEGTVEPETAVKFMTDGVLLREVAQDISLRKYSAIAIDEAHERTINTDILVGMLSRVVKLREDMALEDGLVQPLKLIIMSATLRVTDFTQNTYLFSKPPPVIQAEGKQYQVSTHFTRKTNHDYVEEAFLKICKGHRKLPPGSFLVFLTGQAEIAYLSKRLKEAFRVGHTSSGPQVRISGKDAAIEAEDVEFGDAFGNDSRSDNEDVTIDLDDDDEFNIGDETHTGPAKMHILPLYSLLPTKEQLRVFEPIPEGERLVVLATNVAETSLTIPGIRYVFDCGRSKERKYDHVTGVQGFEIGWISKASAKQRAGRAGRTGPGHCYKLYSSAVYERDFVEHAEPEILRMPIEGVVLQLKAMNLQHVVNFPFPTPPGRQSLASSEKLLQYLSALSPGGQITTIGSTMSIFPLSPRFARILTVGHLHGCLPYTIALVAGLSTADFFLPENQVIPTAPEREKGPFFKNADRLEEDYRASIRRKFNKIHRNFSFLDDRSDAVKILQVVGEFAHEPTEFWCQEHFVRFKILKEISLLRRQITNIMRTNIAACASFQYEEKLEPPSAKQVKALKQMVAAGFLDRVAIRADLTPNPPDFKRKPTRAIDVPYLTLFPSDNKHAAEDNAVYIHPSSSMAHLSPRETPDYMIYSHLQRPALSSVSTTTSKTRVHALTDITGGQLAALAKGTPLLHYGKPLKEVMPKGDGTVKECWVIPYLRSGGGELGWPLPARKVIQKKVPGKGWVVS